MICLRLVNNILALLNSIFRQGEAGKRGSQGSCVIHDSIYFKLIYNSYDEKNYIVIVVGIHADTDDT